MSQFSRRGTLPQYGGVASSKQGTFKTKDSSAYMGMKLIITIGAILGTIAFILHFTKKSKCKSARESMRENATAPIPRDSGGFPKSGLCKYSTVWNNTPKCQRYIFTFGKGSYFKHTNDNDWNTGNVITQYIPETGSFAVGAIIRPSGSHYLQMLHQWSGWPAKGGRGLPSGQVPQMVTPYKPPGQRFTLWAGPCSMFPDGVECKGQQVYVLLDPDKSKNLKKNFKKYAFFSGRDFTINGKHIKGDGLTEVNGEVTGHGWHLTGSPKKAH